MKQLVKHFFVYGLGSTIGKFLSLFLLPIYASVFTPEDYGSLDFILTIATIISIFGMLQIETGLQRFYYEYESEIDRNKLLSTSFVFTLILSLIVTLLSLPFIPFVNDNYFEGKYDIELFISLLVIIPSNLLGILFIDFRYKKKSILFMVINIALVLINALSSICAVKIFDMGILGVVACNTGTLFLIFCICFFIWFKDVKKLSVNNQMLKQMLSFGLPQFPARLGSISNSYINRFFMIGMLSVSAIGIYSVSLKIASGMQLVLSAFQLAWLPYMYELLSKPNHKKELIRSYKCILWILFYCVSLISIFSKDIVLLLTNESYIEAAKYAPILAYYYAFYILKETTDIGVNVAKKPKYTTYIYFIASVLNIVLLYFLTPIYGLYGVTFALLISNALLFFLTLFVSEKLYPIGFPKIPTLIINIIMFGFVLIPSLFNTSLFEEFIIALFLTAVIIFICNKQILNFTKKRKE